MREPIQHEMTRWRELDNPVSPLDPIQPDGPHYEEGRLPAQFVLVLWDGRALRGPMRFETQERADSYVSQCQPPILQYLVLPKPI